MSKLHSLAYTTGNLYGSSLGWYYHKLGVLNADKMSLAMDGIAPSFSPRKFDFSTGYLEDALLEFTERSKRRRLLPCEPSKSSIDLEKSFWNFNLIWHQPAEIFYCMNQIENIGGFLDEYISCTSMIRIDEEPDILAEIETPEETLSASESPDSSSSSYKKDPVIPKITQETLLCIDPTATSAGSDKKNKKVVTRVAYPFELVKPGGAEGDVTLNDINERILMRPTRPVKHPVGDFACRPCVTAEGPGLSGKEVVALTRIHTQGRGTITIIRTKG